MTWKDALENGQEIIVSTCSRKCIPRAIVVNSLGFVNKKLLIGACQMKTTLKNIKETKKVSIVTKYNDEYYRIDGSATIYSSGKYLDIATKRSSPPLPRKAIVIDIKEVFDLDKVKRIL